MANERERYYQPGSAWDIRVFEQWRATTSRSGIMPDLADCSVVTD